MAFQPIFGAVPVQQAQSLLDLLTKRKMENEALASKGAERAFTEAQTKKITEGMAHPELNLAGLPEIARQRAYVESVKRAFGADSPQAMQAQQDLNLTVGNMRNQMAYRQALTETLPKRALSTPGKAIVEQQLVEAGYLPTGAPRGSQIPTQPSAATAPAPIKPQVPGTPLGHPALENKLSTMSKEDLVKAKNSPFGTEENALYTLYLSKLAGMGDNTKKLTYASTLQQTMNQMRPLAASMAYYSGVEGRANYARDLALAQTTGNVTPQLRDYTAFKEIANGAFVPQLTQYYGSSVTEQQQKILRKAADPSTWNKSPDLAATAFDSMFNIIGKEIRGRQDLVKHPSFLTEKQKESPVLSEQIKKTGYSLNEITKQANKLNIPVNDLINELIRLKGES